MSRHWTADEHAELVRLRGEGVAIKNIALALKRQKSAVANYIKRNEIRGGPKKNNGHRVAEWMAANFNDKPCPSNAEISFALLIGEQSLRTAFRLARDLGLMFMARTDDQELRRFYGPGWATDWSEPLNDAAKFGKPSFYVVPSDPTDDLPRVNRDPCGYCGTRLDMARAFGCTVCKAVVAA